MFILPSFFFFFNDTATTEIYTLSLHDALPISSARAGCPGTRRSRPRTRMICAEKSFARSEEHTSELQSLTNLVCRLLLEKKKKKKKNKKQKTHKNDIEQTLNNGTYVKHAHSRQ